MKDRMAEMSMRRPARVAAMTALCSAVFFAFAVSAFSAATVRTYFDNVVYPSLSTNAWMRNHTGTFGFQSAMSNSVTRISESRVAIPVGSVPANFDMGEAMPIPENWDSSTDPILDFLGGPTNLVWIDYANTLLAMDMGPCQVTWRMNDGSQQPILYTISPNPSQRPVRLYWTEGQCAGPPVLMGRNYDVTIHYNSQVRGTNDVWIDSANMLHAARELSGRFLLTYSRMDADSGYRELLAWEIVDVLQPMSSRQDAYVGDRLLPVSAQYDTQDLFSDVTRGAVDETGQDPEGVYVYKHDKGAQQGWIWAIRDTDAPWRIEIYWKAKEALGVVWPFEVDIYQVSWKSDCQKHVISPEGCVPVLFPDELGVELQPRQYPIDHASIDENGHLVADNEGWCLLKYSLDESVWFEAVRTFMRTAPEVNAGWRNWNIGKELAAFGAGVSPDDYNDWPGWLRTETGDRYLKDLYSYPQSYAEGATNRSYLYGVNTGALEAWWFNRTAQDVPEPVYWPSLICCYSNVWRTGAPELTIASGLGSHGMSLVTDTPSGDLRFSPGNTTNYAAVQEAVELDGVVSNFTLEAWVMKAPTGTPGRPILSKGTNGWAWLIWNNRPYLTAPSDQRTVGAGASATVPDYVWHHVAVSYEMNSSTSGVARYYMDGDPAGSETAPFTQRFIRNADSLWIGRHGASATNYWSGRLDEIRVWNVVRSQADIKKYRFGGLQSDESGLVVWYTFEEDCVEGEWILDASVPYHDAIMFGTTITNLGVPAFFGGRDYSGCSPHVYYENDPDSAGYNPNDEHALIMGGTAYGLRNDLSAPDTSPPFVLVAYEDPERGRPNVDVYEVVATNEWYPAFRRELEAGLMIQAPMPLPMLQPAYCPKNDIVSGPYFRDRKGYHWAKQAGNRGGATNIVLEFYYPMQPGFFFPSMGDSQPAPLTEVPWLAGDTLAGQPVDWTYVINWPDSCPVLPVGDTLTNPKNGLPAIRGQLSVGVAYQQSLNDSQKQKSVVLIDPTVARKVALTEVPPGMKTSRDPKTGFTFFTDMPPALRNRLYHNPMAPPGEELQLIGEYRERTDGHNYLLLNVLTGENRAQVLDDERIAGIDDNWRTAVGLLPQTVVTINNDETPFDSLALSAVGTGTGYVTVVFNDSTDRDMVDPSENIDMAVIRVEAPLYRGRLDVILSANPLDKQQTLKYTADFGGAPELYEFKWEYGDPDSGMAPAEDNPSAWFPYALAAGKDYATIGDAGVFGLADHYIRCRYRALDPVVQAVAGTNFNAWTPPTLAEGWIKRVMKAINPYDQRIRDFMNYALNTELSMIQQAGAPYSGDIPLNMDALNDYGLIPIYRTILEQARDLSIDAGIDAGQAVSVALMLAAGRLNDLHMVLANEAYADALDPTIGLGTDDPVYGADASSIFSFMNQQPTLLDEELALLRGRDDSLNPPVTAYPIYNRIAWNFTADIVGGQPVYVLNYGISDAQGDKDGVIDVDDAKALFPQGHGDAWGHYLSALKCYNQLLRHEFFTWMPQAEGILAGDTEITVSFLHEKKLAVAAAAKARTGVDIIKRTYRADFDPAEQYPWRCERDSDGDRAWGMAEWGSRAGMGAYFDWLVGNAVLPEKDANTGHSGIQIIDRTTVPELAEIPYLFRQMQEVVDEADTGLNPLGLAPDGVPFDITVAGIDAGQTHFDQIYGRAVTSLGNALDVFDRVKSCGQALRDQNENSELQVLVQNEEQEIERELIEIFGYPYDDDIGPGKLYPQGYLGPDLIHYNYIDIYGWEEEDTSFGRTIDLVVTNCDCVGYESGRYSDLSGDNTFETYFPDFYKDMDEVTFIRPILEDTVSRISFYVAPGGIPGKPADYKGHRRAEGNIQIALARYVQSLREIQTSYREAVVAYESVAYAAGKLDEELTYARQTDEARRYFQSIIAGLNGAIIAIEESLAISTKWMEAEAAAADAISSAGPTSVGTSVDPSPPIRATAKGKYAIEKVIEAIIVSGVIAAKLSLKEAVNALTLELENAKADLDLAHGQQQAMNTLMEAVWEQAAPMYALLEKLPAAEAARMEYARTLAQGDAVLVRRERLRMNWASDLSAKRYRNMAYRLFRDDQLARYQQVFETAARYTWMAAKAYDYETGLLASDAQHTAGRDFLKGIVKARTLGRVGSTGQPLVGGAFGEPGLADSLARMKSNWDVLKSRMNFNNPETETGRFSLRSELFRISPNASSDKRWREALETRVVRNVLDVPEFKRYCLPFDPMQAEEPAIVIPFASTVEFRKNFFGWLLAGGDNAYDSSHFATKIRSVGVWFVNYDNAFNDGSVGGGLANQPRVYLVPAGIDRMRVPDGRSQTVRDWNVVDQALPVPYPINEDDWIDPQWSVLGDMLGDELFNTRKHGSLRAYHDSGTWSTNEVCNNARLVGRSVWNTRWVLIIPGGTLLSDADKGIERFIHGTELAPDAWDENGVKDIKLIFRTYSYAGN